ncbi:YutD family protein [Eupransor demetentiae]|uniref:DUF1027 family (YutD) n=1 Tax=Eupransor demetentiae TaxID=3109584 RepID=A0ABM9N3N9_9LACO|nr:DUF1027 family (YutD) [Lactobacillaceae bacterium LMG 33000]
MDHESLKERTIAQQEERQKDYLVGYLGDKVSIDNLDLVLKTNFKEAFDPAKLAIRYTPLLSYYDYIVGDISADQLRLKGFYKDDRQAVATDSKIFTFEDYLYEYVNFGAPYFILENLTPRERPVHKNRHHRRRRPASNHPGKDKEQTASKAHEQHKPASPANKNRHRRSNHKKTTNNNSNRHQFTIKEKS